MLSNLDTISGWSGAREGAGCVGLVFLRWKLCVRTGGPKMNVPRGGTTALPAISLALAKLNQGYTELGLIFLGSV